MLKKYKNKKPLSSSILNAIYLYSLIKKKIIILSITFNLTFDIKLLVFFLINTAVSS